MKAIVTWILVADGAEARLFVNDGPGKGLAPLSGVNISETRVRNQELARSRPGRAFHTAGPNRSGLNPRTDPVQQREAEFVQGLAAMLDEKRAAGAFDRLIIAAAPTALGVIRRALSPAVESVLLAEIPKNLTNVPTDRMAPHFSGTLAV